MGKVLLALVSLMITGHFGWAIVCGIKDKRLHNRYGPNFEVDFREEPLGFIGVTIFYIASWCLLASATAVVTIKAYNFIFT